LRDPEVLRFFLLGSHYMGPVNYSATQLAQADETLLGLYRALNDTDVGAGDAVDAEAWRQFETAMNDDFNTPDAFAVMQGVARELNTSKAAGAGAAARVAVYAATLRAMGKILGVLQQEPGAYLKRSAGASGLTDGEIDSLVRERSAARAGKQFAESDRIRSVLAEKGVIIEDKPGAATAWRRA